MIRKSQRQLDKLIEAAQDAIEFDVFGEGPFPIDMLRYDLCWPASELNATTLAATFTNRVSVHGIKLKGLKPPTPARWASFGWKVQINGVQA
jgi:hypothetical protein